MSKKTVLIQLAGQPHFHSPVFKISLLSFATLKLCFCFEFPATIYHFVFKYFNESVNRIVIYFLLVQLISSCYLLHPLKHVNKETQLDALTHHHHLRFEHFRFFTWKLIWDLFFFPSSSIIENRLKAQLQTQTQEGEPKNKHT